MMKLKKSNLLLFVVSLVLALYYAFPFLLNINNWGMRDWDLFTTVQAVALGSIINYGQFPFWNPYLSGGNICFHHPEIGVLTPFFLLQLIFGVVAGLKLQVFILFSTRLGMSKMASILVAVVYFGSVHFALHFAEGHIPFTHFCFLPWFLYFIIKSQDGRKNIALAGLMLALIILGNGAAIPLLYTMTFSFLFFLFLSLQEKKISYFVNFVLSTVLGVALAAVKFLPMVVYMAQNIWRGDVNELIPLSGLIPIFFGINQRMFATNFESQKWCWHEYGAYISPLLVLLAVIALLLKFRRYWWYMVLAVFFLLLGLGNFSQFSPWALLSQLPGFSSARCTGRAFQLVILVIALLGGFGYDIIIDKIKKYPKRLIYIIPYTLVAFILFTNFYFVWPIMSSTFIYNPPEVYRSPVFEHLIGSGDRGESYKNFLANRGTLRAPKLSAYKVSRALIDENDVIQKDYIMSGNGVVLKRFYTPNVIKYEIRGVTGGEIVINMGYDPGWRAVDGREIRETNGLISFNFGEGKQKVVLKYRTPYFFTGFIISFLALVISGYIFYPKNKHKLYGQESKHVSS